MIKPAGIYLDNHATTLVAPTIVSGLVDLLTNVGNASSTDHEHGGWARTVIAKARAQIAAAFRADPASIIFTSGATEAANLVLRSIASETPRCTIITSAVEHPSVLETAREVTTRSGGELRIVDVDARGRLDLAQLEGKAAGATIGCFMAANHEVGAIYPIVRIGAVLKGGGARFLCDATQAVGKVGIDLVKSHIDYLIFSGHKIHALQGVGAIASPTMKHRLRPFMTGGGQQDGVRPGTYNLPGIWSLGRAVEDACGSMAASVPTMSRMRDRLWQLLRDQCTDVILTGELDDRLANNLHVCVRGIENTMIIERLRGKVSVSTGAACSSGAIEPSRVLKAMRVPRDLIDGALRIGLSRFTTEGEIEEAAHHLVAAVNDVRALTAQAK